MSTNDVVELRDEVSGATARVLPALGFNCVSFTVPTDGGGEPVEVLWAEPGVGPGSKATRSGIPLLFPFGGRFKGTSFAYEGQTYETPGALANGGNSIHGFVLNRPWRVTGRSADSVLGEFQASVDDPALLGQWPADFLIRVGYTVSGATLRSTIEVENPDSKSLPFGFATHPYFALPARARRLAGGLRRDRPRREAWVLEDLLPTARRRPVSGATTSGRRALARPRFDDVLTGLTPDRRRRDVVEMTIADPVNGRVVRQRCTGPFRECVV
jgi:aldose 1-epimerase